MTEARKTVHIVCGPTASGKSARAIELAQQEDGIIINCDSVQIYEGLPILSAQPADEDLKAVPHKLYGHLHPNDVCSAGHWREIAEPLIHDVLAEDKAPIICGGSGLYIKALMEGLSPMPDIPDHIRERAIKMQKEWDAPTLHAELQKRDPVMAERLDPNNKARLVRAWEVLEATGKSLSEWQKLDKQAPPADWVFNVEIIIPERDELYCRCNDRFHVMMDQGALAEAEAFNARIESGEVGDGTPASKALGFIQLQSYLKGDISKDEAIERAQAETRHYAKRQTTWFRNQF